MGERGGSGFVFQNDFHQPEDDAVARCLLVYSSVTGNTRMVAEAIRAVLPECTDVFAVRNAPTPEEYDLVILGFWVHRAGPDPMMTRYMETVRGCAVAFFGTLAAYPDSPHAQKVIARAEALLDGNRILGSFLCQGKLAPGRFEKRMRGDGADGNHPMTEERRARLVEAARHPDERDLARAKEVFARIAAAMEHTV